MRQKPRQFYRCTPANDEGVSRRRLLLALSLRSRESYSAALNTRWEVVCRIEELSKCIRNISVDSMMPSVDPRTPMKTFDQAYGFWESFAIVPIDLEAITIYGTRIAGHTHVCGLDFLTRDTRQHVGAHSNLVYRQAILHNQANVICFLVDSLGVRGLGFGRSAWSFEDPKRHHCWEGISIRKGEGRIRIVRDVCISLTEV